MRMCCHRQIVASYGMCALIYKRSASSAYIMKYFLWLICFFSLNDAQPNVLSPIFSRAIQQQPSSKFSGENNTYSDLENCCVGYTNMYSKMSGLSGTTEPYFISKLNFDSIPGMIVVGAA